MRPAQRVKQAEEAARRLKALLGSSTMAQLLQRTPPAALTAEQKAQLSRCCDVISQLAAAVKDAPSLRMQVLDAMLKQEAACSAGSLLTWVQQQPEQQLLDVTAVAIAGHQAPAAGAVRGTTAAIWVTSVHLVERCAAVALLQVQDSAGGSLAASLTQQLDHSGKPACRRMFECTAQ
jgi:hypothetical protein